VMYIIQADSEVHYIKVLHSRSPKASRSFVQSKSPPTLLVAHLPPTHACQEAICDAHSPRHQLLGSAEQTYLPYLVAARPIIHRGGIRCNKDTALCVASFNPSNMTAQSKPVVISPWTRAAAGATGAVLANALVYPLDMYGQPPSRKSLARLGSQILQSENKTPGSSQHP
jgi:hypothetical protein